MSMSTTRRALRERGVSGPAPVVHPHRGRGAASALGDIALWVAAAAGVVCMVLVVLALTANITLILFRTGSMSPTIPAGSVAVVQRVPASEIEVGDVVTVDREGDLPVTHRVTSVAPGEGGVERVITMRGDANDTDDPYPYTVTMVRTVLFSIPGIATVIVALGDPFVLGGLTIAASVLVVWAFWPRSTRGRRASGGSRRSAARAPAEVES